MSDKLTGYEIQIDFERNSILILRTPNYPDSDDENIITIEIKAANRAELEQLKSSFEQGKDVSFTAEVELRT